MKKLILFFIMLILLASFASSAKDILYASYVQGEGDLTIVYPKIQIHPQNEILNLSYDVLDSNLTRLNTDDVDCSFFVVNNVGRLVSSGDLLYNQYWYYELPVTITNTVGSLNYYVYCNSTLIYNGLKLNGYVSDSLVITQDGNEFIGKDSNIMVAMIIGLLGTALFLLFFAYKLDKEHFVLKFISMFTSFALVLLIPNTLINNITNTTDNYYWVILWSIRICIIYVFVYFSYKVLEKFGLIVSGDKDSDSEEDNE